MMSQDECGFAMVSLSDLGGLLQALNVLHGLVFPDVSQRYVGLLSRLTENPSGVELLEIRQFCDWATSAIEPALRDLPQYQAALRGWLSQWEGGATS